jgi:hypothetical protein
MKTNPAAAEARLTGNVLRGKSNVGRSSSDGGNRRSKRRFDANHWRKWK